MNWSIKQSTIHPSFWIAVPQVPGGRPRVMATDDFGNLYEADSLKTHATLALTKLEMH